MSYLIGFHWAWLLLSLILGVVVGWCTYLRPRTRWMDGLVWIVVALIALGALLAISTLIPGRPGYWLDVAVLMGVAYGIGCPVGWALRHQAFRDPASAADHDSRLPKPGYVFPGGTLGGGETRPAAIVTTAAASEIATPMPGPTPSPAAPALEPQLAEPHVAELHVAEPTLVQPAPVEPIVAAPVSPTVVPAPAAAADPGDATPAPPTPAAAMAAPPAASPTAPEDSLSPAVPKGIRVAVDTVPPEPPSAAVSALTAAADPVAAAPATPGKTIVEAPAATTASATETPEKAPPLPDEGRHAGVRPDGFVTARGNTADDLKRIKGIGPQNEGRLHGLGIWHFDQIAAWAPDNVKWVGSYLAFPGRIEREKWIDQAKALASGQDTEFSKRVAAGKVATSRDDGSQGQANVDGSIKPRKR